MLGSLQAKMSKWTEKVIACNIAWMWSWLFCKSKTRKMTSCVQLSTSAHRQVLISLASWISPRFTRAVCSMDQDGTPCWLTPSCCCSQAANISIIQSLMSPCCSFFILFSVGYRRPNSSPSDCQSWIFFKNLFTLARSAISAYCIVQHYL